MPCCASSQPSPCEPLRGTATRPPRRGADAPSRTSRSRRDLECAHLFCHLSLAERPPDGRLTRHPSSSTSRLSSSIDRLPLPLSLAPESKLRDRFRSASLDLILVG